MMAKNANLMPSEATLNLPSISPSPKHAKENKKDSLAEYGLAPMMYGADSSLIQMKAMRNFRSNINE